MIFSSNLASLLLFCLPLETPISVCIPRDIYIPYDQSALTISLILLRRQFGDCIYKLPASCHFYIKDTPDVHFPLNKQRHWI